jgi:SAM-dependent methyltransferase
MASQREGWGFLAGCDRSPGMIATGLELVDDLPLHLYVCDAQALPISDRAFDVVMARHMLYHVPDIDCAVSEAARVLQPGGRFLVTTNSACTMPEYWELRDRAAQRFPAMAQIKNVNERFSLENGRVYLEPYFDQIEVQTLHGTLRFPSAGPFVDYFASTRALTMCPGHTDAEWQAVVDFVQTEAEAVIARVGQLDVTKLTGAIVAVKGG